MLEKSIERKLCDEVKARQGYAYKFTSPGNDGVPDRIVISKGGQITFVELKAEHGRLSKMQEFQIRRLKRLGCKVKVIRGMAGVEAFLEELDNAKN